MSSPDTYLEDTISGAKSGRRRDLNRTEKANVRPFFSPAHKGFARHAEWECMDARASTACAAATWGMTTACAAATWGMTIAEWEARTTPVDLEAWAPLVISVATAWVLLVCIWRVPRGVMHERGQGGPGVQGLKARPRMRRRRRRVQSLQNQSSRSSRSIKRNQHPRGRRDRNRRGAPGWWLVRCWR